MGPRGSNDVDQVISRARGSSSPQRAVTRSDPRLSELQRPISESSYQSSRPSSGDQPSLRRQDQDADLVYNLT